MDVEPDIAFFGFMFKISENAISEIVYIGFGNPKVKGFIFYFSKVQ